MDQTDYNQIKIYEDIFKNFDVNTIKGNPIDCIKYNTSYCGIYNKTELPVMIGSKYDLHDNPLKIKGYFIINGICKSVNNIRKTYKTKYTKDRVYLNNGDCISIIDMFNFKLNDKKWKLPLNWMDIVKYSKNHKDQLEKHLTIVAEVQKVRFSEIIKLEIDLINLCYMFESWLGLRESPDYYWRLITPGEIIMNCIKNNVNVVQCFKTNKWVYNNQVVTTISEDMKHYNIIGDIESIRKVTLLNNRENRPKSDRIVKDRYSVCPVQTPDGSICGTVNYLCKDIKLLTSKADLTIIEGNDVHLYVNNLYKGKVDKSFIGNLKGYKIMYIDLTCYIYREVGFIINNKEEVSYSASLINYRLNNPPIRAMFACSMIKQSIEYDTRNIRKLIDNSKTLVNDIDKRVEVAIMPWYGYNIEDGIVVSRSLANKYKYIKTRIYKNDKIKIVKVYQNPGDDIKIGDCLYKYIDKRQTKTVNIVYTENSGTIESIESTDEYIKIIVSETKSLKVGDKMTSLHGQKGVISLIEEDHKMPYYNKNGMKVIIDLIINPHAFPSRMTMGQIKEMGDNLETVYINKIPVKNKIIVGKCKYIALRHQVDDKFQYRNGGNFDVINKQPVSGRKNNGGIRFGQMERDILIALGEWNIIKQFWKIDSTNIMICPNTGTIKPTCCRGEPREIGQYVLICLSYLRALGYDIKIKEDKYCIDEFNDENIPITETLNFGDVDPLDLKKMDDNIVLPICLRSNKINMLYKNIPGNKKYILQETKSLLKSKNGAYHKLVEGHRIDKCIRSVITPNPNLSLDEVLIPIEANIGCEYGILNRQPSLNSSSIKIVRLKVHEHKTIAFNPLLCKSFNADFDGDEMNIYGIKEYNNPISNKGEDTQDYILGDLISLTENGLTASKKDIKLMIEKGSKGKGFNYQQIYKSITDSIHENYYEGVSDDTWYELAKQDRENIISIALNTPITGELRSQCIQRLI